MGDLTLDFHSPALSASPVHMDIIHKLEMQIVHARHYSGGNERRLTLTSNGQSNDCFFVFR
jgi:hypothetical protein